MAWTADDLVAAVRRRAQLPSASEDGAINDADILLLADEELSLRLVPLVRSVRGDYWVRSEDVPVVANQAAYRVPERAQTSGLREVTVIDSGGIAYHIPQISVEDAWRWAQPNANIVGSMRSSAFYMEGTDLVIVPTPSDDSWTIRMRYYRAMSALVPNDQCGLVIDAFIDPPGAYGGEMIQILTLPSGWQQLANYPAQPLDLVYSGPPFGVPHMDITPLDVVVAPDYLIEVTSIAALGLVPAPAYGLYYLCKASQTCVVDLPRECWALLVSAVAARVLDLIGDREAAQLEYTLYEREAQNVTLLLTPRVEGNPIRIVDRNSLLRSQRRW